MSTYHYLRLPIDADEGFPQAFRLVVADLTYSMSLSVTIVDEALLADRPITLPVPGAYLVMTVLREVIGAATPIFRSKLVPNLEYAAQELGFLFTRMVIHPRNLNGTGQFGSEVVGGVAQRWAS